MGSWDGMHGGTRVPIGVTGRHPVGSQRPMGSDDQFLDTYGAIGPHTLLLTCEWGCIYSFNGPLDFTSIASISVTII